MTRRLAVGVDVGGTAIKAGIVDDGLTIVAQSSVKTATSAGSAAVMDDIAGCVDRLVRASGVERRDVVGLGLGSPGPLSPSRGLVHGSPNLPGWEGVALREGVAQRTGLATCIDNDANVAAYGEYRVLDDAAVTDMVVFTLGTGVGSGAIVGGRVFRGAFENASEWGHMILHPKGRACNCGQRGCLEQYASATAVVRVALERIEGGGSSVLAERVGRGAGSLTSQEVMEAARGGDALAAGVWDEACLGLAVACINVQHALNPQRILLGGGMSAAGSFLVDRVRGHVERLRWRLFEDVPSVGLARLGNDAGVIGAAALALDEAEAGT